MKRYLALLILSAAVILEPAFCLASVAVEDEEVVFKLAGAGADSVFLVGDFNGWNSTIDLMVMGEGGFEIRLYLLPGTYRYRFVADGAPVPDPDNPCRDLEGNSCFTLVQRDGALEVAFALEAGALGAGPRIRVTPHVRVEAFADENASALFSTAGVECAIGETIDADLAAGLTEEFLEGRAADGRSFLLRGLATYHFGRGVLSAFTRPSAAIDLEDAIGLIGPIGPFRYPMSLFSRGVDFQGVLPLGLETRFLYLSRLRGFRSGLEGAADSSDIFSGRDFVDSDIYGLRLGAKIARGVVRYLFREDRRPRPGAWRFPALGEGLYVGFERDEFHGASLTLAGDGGVVLDAELLFGRSHLSATGRLLEETEGHDDIRSVSREAEWEHGRRFSIRVSRTGERLHAGLLCAQTTLEGERSARGWRPDGSRTSVGGSFSFGDSVLAIGVEGKIEQYSSLNTGSTFWLARSNFWLDGDELAYDCVPFLSSREIYEVALSCRLKSEPLGGAPWGRGVRLEMIQRGDASDGWPLFREVRLAGGVTVHPRLAVLLDMRGVSYEYDGRRRDFVDAFVCIQAFVTKSLWCAVGTGVNPYAFDRWVYTFSDHGREDYLYERGVFRALAERGEAASMKTLLDAEEGLAEDRVVTFEAGFTF